MNGAQDMGGMHGFGPVRPEPDEPAFHAAWERRAFALTLAMGATGAWNLDLTRATRESLPPARYLASSYYEIWLAALEALLVRQGLVEQDELADGGARVPAVPVARVLRADAGDAVLSRGSPTVRPAERPAAFEMGQHVRTRNLNPSGHTRLPRYARGRHGRIVALHGAHVFADAHARGEGDAAAWLYTVEFDARELWGPDTTATTVRIDCWEPHLEATQAADDRGTAPP